MKSMITRLVAIAGIAAFTMSPTIASADPKFEVSPPISAASIPGSLLHSPSFIRWKPEGPSKKVAAVESEGVPGGQAIEFRVKKKSNKPWDVRMRAPFDQDISEGETIEIYFWARASKPRKGQDHGKISVAIGRTVEPHDVVMAEEVLPTTEWKMYKVAGTAKRDFPTDESDMGFNFGFAKQTVELGPFFAVSRGQSQN